MINAEVDQEEIDAEVAEDSISVEVSNTAVEVESVSVKEITANTPQQDELNIEFADPLKVTETVGEKDIESATLESEDITRDDNDRIIEVDLTYDDGDTNYDLNYSGTGSDVSGFTKEVLNDNFEFDIQEHTTSYTRDSKERITEKEIVKDSGTVTYSISWDENDNITSFDRTES